MIFNLEFDKREESKAYSLAEVRIQKNNMY